MTAHILTPSELGFLFLFAVAVFIGCCVGMAAQEWHSKRRGGAR